MLTKYQRETIDKMFKAVENKECCILDGSQRCTGKTYLLNELGFELQAVGYNVILLVRCVPLIKFCACKSVSAVDTVAKIMGQDRRTTVVITDNWEYSGRDFRELKGMGYIIVGFDIKYPCPEDYAGIEATIKRLDALMDMDYETEQTEFTGEQFQKLLDSRFKKRIDPRIIYVQLNPTPCHWLYKKFFEKEKTDERR